MDHKSLLECPCCSSFIYDLFQCSNKHNLCGNCWIKIKKCPICRNSDLYDANDLLDSMTSQIKRDSCEYCEKLLYYFDDDHGKWCTKRPFICKFCKLVIDVNDRFCETISKHFNDNCTNSFTTLIYPYSPKDETLGKIFQITNIQANPTISIFGDEYCVISIPKPNTKKLVIYIFSSNYTYQGSNHKVKIKYHDKKIEACILFKQFGNIIIDLTNEIEIENQFLLNRKIEQYEFGNTTFVKVASLDGEPGSAGNWSKQSYDDILKSFTNIFSKT